MFLYTRNCEQCHKEFTLKINYIYELKKLKSRLVLCTHCIRSNAAKEINSRQYVKEKHSQASLRNWKDPEFRSRVFQSQKIASSSETTKRKRSEAQQKIQNSIQVKQKKSKTLAVTNASAEVHTKRSLASKLARSNPENEAKRQQTMLQRYGVVNLLRATKVREKIRQTNLAKYNVENPLQSEKIREKVKQTNFSRYGVEHPLQSEGIQAKVKQTNLERYGVEYYTQSKEMQSKRKQTYRYDDVNFDSKPELAFYVYCKNHGVEIQRNTRKFEYEIEGKTHRYFPDFVVEGELVEIKGSHFLKEGDTWQNPFDHSQDKIYEAKHQCAIQNNVKILYSKDYQKCIDYVLEKYGKDFFERCRNSQKTCD